MINNCIWKTTLIEGCDRSMIKSVFHNMIFDINYFKVIYFIIGITVGLFDFYQKH